MFVIKRTKWQYGKSHRQGKNGCFLISPITTSCQNVGDHESPEIDTEIPDTWYKEQRQHVSHFEMVKTAKIFPLQSSMSIYIIS